MVAVTGDEVVYVALLFRLKVAEGAVVSTTMLAVPVPILLAASIKQAVTVRVPSPPPRSNGNGVTLGGVKVSQLVTAAQSRLPTAYWYFVASAGPLMTTVVIVGCLL